MKFSQLPTHVQTEIKSTLSAFSDCNVKLSKDGVYKVRTFTSVHTGEYDQFIGKYTSDEVFSVEERIINYVKSFRDFPFRVNGVTYEGKKDWQAINSNWIDVVMNGNGDLEFIF
jgi:hypothetical protein|tara:strand:+ start:172 stop:513 length:342 start_codon:yes stop_codon:yes gene_type:complete